MRERLRGALAPTIAFAAVLALWQASVWILRPPPFILPGVDRVISRSEEHTSELQSRRDLVCRLLLEKKKVPRLGRTRPLRHLLWIDALRLAGSGHLPLS